MTESDNAKELRKIVADVLSTTEEIKSLIPPLIRDQQVALKALKSHEEAISALMTHLLGTDEEHKRSALRLEMVSKKSDIFEQKLKSHESFQDLLDKRMTVLENQQIREIDGKILSGQTPSKAELQTIDEFIKIHPDNPQLIGLKAKALKSTGDAKQAAKWIEDSIAKHPNVAYLWHVKGLVLDVSRIEERVKSFDKSLELLKEDRKVSRHLVYFSRAGVLAQSDRLADALSSVEKAVEYGPECSHGWALKGFILKDLNRIPESLGCFEKSLELDQESYRAWLGKGQVLAILGPDHYEESVACFDKSILLHPEEPAAYFAKADVLSHMKLPTAIDSIEEGLKRSPKDPCAWCRKGMILMQLKRHADALDSFDKSLELGASKDCAVVFAYKADALVELGRIPEARDWLMRLDGKEMQDPHSLNSYSWSLYRVGEFKKGIEMARKAIEMDSNNPYFLDTLACNLVGNNSDSEALQVFQKAISLRKSDDSISWRVFASLCDRMGLREEADMARTKAKRPKPDQP